MKSLFHLALEIQNFMQDCGWKFCFIGGIALQRWGEPRLTRDVDVSLLTGLGQERSFIDKLCNRFVKRIPDAYEFALKNRVLLIESAGGIPIDISLAGLGFEHDVISRASSYSFLEGIDLITCSAEDLVVYKSFAGRTKDWADVECIILRSGKKLDKDYIFSQLSPLSELKEDPDAVPRLKNLINELMIN